MSISFFSWILYSSIEAFSKLCSVESTDSVNKLDDCFSYKYYYSNSVSDLNITKLVSNSYNATAF